MICPISKNQCINLSCINKCILVYNSADFDYSCNNNLIKFDGFQKCPVCNGDGTDHHSFVSSSIPVCKVCNGKRIISTSTGQPPL